MKNVSAATKAFEKLLCGVLLALIVAFVCPCEANAKTYEIEEIGMSLDIPSTYDVFTRDMAR